MRHANLILRWSCTGRATHAPDVHAKNHEQYDEEEDAAQP
eukprot:CAMPEP_0197685344 /NCGR_PEP_ID=MMETSP1338-20131121/100801_1 /TAXON_ID=43686 ORGANISM="Pelagodinium beii, Strain RCC1491" /NCGR_SAMPLE_ID=MMETSP1338 /ASSEMBLY_ACC=CAM_ASM_000754 /LENGTH=39 /DNA_ID= /DNA_START= /DNA_END= /DNA_ORIENTATION=